MSSGSTEPFGLEGTFGDHRTPSSALSSASLTGCTSEVDDFAWAHRSIFPREESGPQVCVQCMLHYLPLCHL